ncbi:MULTISPECIES: magnesium transporter [Shewanella]|uniref:magnesium transporter n=1 Tax=Shewanella TaxID=22 RepID=UPI001183E259|nr:magnesium transporter [Shewanella algae]EKT4486570.1 magnesium transporter [Shewanella algae]MBO2549610.1 magnesium transporter [Shewanella algae]TVO90970.1 magnesium transporter [Shewanella algae]TXS86893.1 magnesium transporter [Shewanella algae]
MNSNNIILNLHLILANKDAKAMQMLASELHPADIAAVLPTFDSQQTASILTLCQPKTAAALLRYLPHQQQKLLAEALDHQTLGKIIMEMAADERADLYNELEIEQQALLLPTLAKAEREDMRTLAAYDDSKVGSIMTSDYALLRVNQTAEEAIDSLRKVAADLETIYQTYVVDERGRLIGNVSLRQLIIAPPKALVRDFMKEQTIAIEAEAFKEEAAQMIAHYDLLALPVVNGNDQLVGIVTYDDAMDVASAQADAEFSKHGAVGQLACSFKEASIGMLYRKRVFWLVLLVFGNVFSGTGIAYFEDTITAYVALVFFLPLLIGSSGNAGSQSATLMVRALATGEVVLKDWLSLLAKELFVAGLLGATMAIAVFTLGYWRGGDIALVVALTMQLVVIIGSLIGMSLPFLLSKFKLDPASASAPLVTSIADIIGVIVYFNVATAILDFPPVSG